MHESPLCIGPGANDEVYRLTWLPSFNHSVVVRIQFDSGAYRFEARTETGAGGYEPGELARDTVLILNAKDVAQFSSLLARADFWHMPTTPTNSTIGFDGSQWILEGLVADRYHVVDRWSPQPEGPDVAYHALGSWLLAKSGLAPRLH